jgi:hypothetical protein
MWVRTKDVGRVDKNMVQQTSSPTEGANYRRLGRRIATITALSALTLSSAVAAQPDGPNPNPITEFVNDLAPEILPPLMAGAALVAIVAHLASGFVTNPQNGNRAKQLRNGALTAFVGAPVLMAFLDYIAPILPFGMGEGLDLVPFAMLHLAQLL